MTEDWNDVFYNLFKEAVGRYHAGNGKADGFFTEQEARFLYSIGCRPKELFDYIVSYVKTGAPSPTCALLIAAVRRDFFLTMQKGVYEEVKPVIEFDLPKFGAELSGIPYLPRLIAIARAKLEGTLGPDLMYGSENDCRFFREHGHIHPADFLRVVWSAGTAEAKVYDYVHRCSLNAAPAQEEENA